MHQKIILITGGAGFIGSNIAAQLSERGDHRIVICDFLGDGDKWKNLAKHNIHEIVAPAALFYWLEMYGGELEAVIHMAAISSTTETDVDLILETNHAQTILLWRWCAENAVRFVYASSAATYGNGEQGYDDSMDEKYLAALRPMNPYGWSKHLFDRHVATCLARGERIPPQWAGLKFFNVYGPNEYHKGAQQSVIAHIFEDAQAGRAVKLFKSQNPAYADGGQLRDFIYVKDCVNVTLWLLDNPKISGLFNCGTGKARGFANLAAATFAALGQPPQINYIDMPEGLAAQYQYHTEAKMDRLRAAGYTRPFFSLEDGAKDYVQNYLSRKDRYR